MEKDILDEIFNHYINTMDCKGTPITTILDKFKDIIQIKKTLKKLITDKKILLYYCQVNCFVKNFDLNIEPKEIDKLIDTIPDNYDPNANMIEIVEGIKINAMSEDFSFSFFPTSQYLDEVIGNKKEYLELPPFTKMIRFGTPHLRYLYFKIDVLNRFLQDPRYQVTNLDYKGTIFYDNDDEADENYIYLKYFGLAYNTLTNENLITIFPSDLSKLSPKHQAHFYSYMLKNQNDCIPDLSYHKNVMGEFSEGISIFSALLMEIELINQMTVALCGVKLFKKEFSSEEHKRPEYFHPFLLPTKIVYGDFCRTLSKIFTDALDKNSIIKIAKRVGYKIQTKSPTGQDKGTLALLEDFFNNTCNPSAKIGTEIANPWKKDIRSIRSKASHTFIEDKYDISIFFIYRETIYKAYNSIRTLRLVFSKHPVIADFIAKGEIEIPDDLYLGKINNYFTPLKLNN